MRASSLQSLKHKLVKKGDLAAKTGVLLHAGKICCASEIKEKYLLPEEYDDDIAVGCC